MISVCMATHNGGKYIRTQLESILCQLGADDEVIISDDGSTDNTFEIIESFKDSRIKVYHFQQPSKSKHPHLYVTRNFENALKHAKGNYIFLSDQDDMWMPNKVGMCMDALKSYDLVIHNFEMSNHNLTEKGLLKYGAKFKFRNYLMLDGKYYGCAMAFNRKILNRALPFPQKLLLHDFWIGIIGETFGNATYISRPLIKYRQLKKSVSHNTHNSRIHSLNYRLYIIFHLLYRIMSK